MSIPYEIIYDGTKTFPTAKKVIDILLVLHPGDSILEVVSYHAESDQEAPRMYLSRAVLERKVKACKDSIDISRTTKCSVSQKILKKLDLSIDIYSKLASYVLSHLGYKNHRSRHNHVSIKLCFREDNDLSGTPASGVGMTACEHAVVEKPHTIIAFDSRSWKLLRM